MSLASLFKAIADAIRAKTGSADPIAPADFPDAIGEIEGTDLSGVTATAGDVLTGKKYMNSSGVLTDGTMASNAPQEISIAVNGSYTIPVGYHLGTGKVKNTTPVLQAQTIYPTASNKTLSAGNYLQGVQTIHGITQTNLTAGNIKNGVTVNIGNGSENIFSVTGTYDPEPDYVVYKDVKFSSNDPECAKVTNAHGDKIDGHTFGAYSDTTTVVGITVPAYKITLPADAKLLLWKAEDYLTKTDGSAPLSMGFIKDFSYKGGADGSGRGSGVTEFQCASFCERPDGINPNKKIVYVPAERINASTYKATFAIKW